MKEMSKMIERGRRMNMMNLELENHAQQVTPFLSYTLVSFSKIGYKSKASLLRKYDKIKLRCWIVVVSLGE